jgi:hypothetical protein
MKKNTHPSILRQLSARMIITLTLSLALLLFVQVALTAKPAPGRDNDDDLPDRVLFDKEFERDSFVALPELPVPAVPIPLPENVWRIGIFTDGLYALDYAILAQAGVPVTGSAANDYHVLWRGEEVALDGIGLEDTTLDPGDALLFYGEKFHGSTQDEKYTDENVYWLSFSTDSAGLRMSERDVSPVDMLPAATMCTGTTAIEENLVHWPRFTTYPGTDTTWFWDRIPHSPGVTVTYEISLNNPIITETALLEVEVAARSTSNHLVRLAMNGTNLGVWTWIGKVGKIINAVIPPNTLVDGSNNLHIYTDELKQMLYFDRAEVTYSRQPVASPQGLFCDGKIHTPSTYTITAVPIGARLYDTSDALHPIELTDFITHGQNLIFRESLTDEVRYLAQLPNPVIVSAYSPNLNLISPTSGADEIVIAPRIFMDALTPLISHRESQGLRISAVAVEDIYPLFNGGIFHPEAIRAFVAHAYNNWPGNAPQYLFLVGDGNFNFKGYNPVDFGTYTPSWIPPYLAFDDPTQGEVPLDVLFGDIDGNGMPEVMVGRIPAQTEVEVSAYVDKILAYEMQPLAEWHAKALLVADNGGTFDEGFDSSLNRLDDYIPSYIKSSKVYMEDYCAPSTSPCPSASLAVTQSWNAGAALLIYSGHGSIHRWAHEPLLFNVDLTSLTQTEKLPFLVSLDCWDGYWMFPPTYPAVQGRDVRSIGEWATTVLTETGAIANFGPAGLAYAYQQEAMAEAMLKRIFNDHELHLGQITQAGREAIQSSYLSRIMTLLGDPAMPLKIVSLNHPIYLPMVIRNGVGDNSN